MNFISGRTVKLGRLAGVRIELDYSWFIIFFLIFFSLSFQYFPALYSFSTVVNVALGLGTTILFFASVLVHELAHSVVSNRSGLPIKKIILFIFGGVASLSREPCKPGVELKIAIAGPATSFILSGFFYLSATVIAPLSLPVTVAFHYLSIINFVLAAFNLVPGYPLDGGRILRSLLWMRMSLERATVIAARAGMTVGFLLIAYGVFQLLYLGSLFGLIWLSLIGYFLITVARDSVTQTLLSRRR